jgi:hypothetical protein
LRKNSNLSTLQGIFRKFNGRLVKESALRGFLSIFLELNENCDGIVSVFIGFLSK